MNKLALHFGAGNIGRGFIAPVLKENNYDVIFVDVDKSLINKIKKEKHFDIKLIESKNLYKSIDNIGTDYDYLIKMPIYSLSQDKIDELQKELEKNTNE